MNAVDCIRCDIDGTLKTKGHIRSINIIVNGLREMNDIQPLFPKQVCRLLCSVTAQDDQTVQIQLVVSLLHGLDLVQSVLIRNTHQLKRLAAGTQNRSTLCQDTGEIGRCKQPVIAIDQALISVLKSIYFQLIHIAG